MYLTQSEFKQLDLLKQRSPIARFMMMADLIDSQIETMGAGLRYQNPGLTDKEIRQCLKKKMKKIYKNRIDSTIIPAVN